MEISVGKLEIEYCDKSNFIFLFTIVELMMNQLESEYNSIH